ncbi:MAG TPA: hypothetical protein VF881_00250 [Polyangiaceae bacterium]
MADETKNDVMLPPELLSAFPVGGLAFLAGIATVLAAEHGALAARELFATLAASDSFWCELQARFEATLPGPAFEPFAAEPVATPAHANRAARQRRTNGAA